MVDAVAAAFFKAQMESPENNICMDGGDHKAEWASVSHGTYICIGAAGVHRSLGVKTSFVQSTNLDSWRPSHLKMMELGGNARFAEFMRAHGVPEDMPIREKYSTRAAAWYRKSLRAEAEGTELPEPLPEGTGHLPAEETLGRSNSSGEAVLDQVFSSHPAVAGEARAVAVVATKPLVAAADDCGDCSEGSASCCKRVCDGLSSALAVAKKAVVGSRVAAGKAVVGSSCHCSQTLSSSPALLAAGSAASK
jgi:hypothetical protein